MILVWRNYLLFFVRFCIKPFPSDIRINLFCPHLVLYDTKHFRSILTNLSNLLHRRWPFLFHQKFPLLSSDLKNVLRNIFQKCSGLQMFFKEGVIINFLIFTRKYLCLGHFFHTVTGLMACNFIKKESPTQMFSCEYHKMFAKTFFFSQNFYTDWFVWFH